jgi:hypothetical protein
MEELRIPKKMLKAKFEGCKPVGKHRKIWEDCIWYNDVTLIGIQQYFE